jgi:hypothetical protein
MFHTKILIQEPVFLFPVPTRRGPPPAKRRHAGPQEDAPAHRLRPRLPRRPRAEALRGPPRHGPVRPQPQARAARGRGWSASSAGTSGPGRSGPTTSCPAR